MERRGTETQPKRRQKRRFSGLLYVISILNYVTLTGSITDGLKSIQKELITVYRRYYPRFCLKRFRNSKKPWDRLCPHWDFSPITSQEQCYFVNPLSKWRDGKGNDKEDSGREGQVEEEMEKLQEGDEERQFLHCISYCIVQKTIALINTFFFCLKGILSHIRITRP
jgi:hypothetical protein